MSKQAEAVWDQRLKCNVVSVAYDFRSHTGQVYLLDGDCCDMAGWVALFEGIDPKVTAISTHSGNQADKVYRKQGVGWKALPPSNS